jgi:SAM-dependent methyltransferase
MQEKHPQWQWQWQKIYDDSQWLFTEWIQPNTLEIFRDKDVLDCGCGGGQHLNFTAPYCKSALGVDLNAVSVAKDNTKNLSNVSLQEADIAIMDLGKQFDVVYSIGVLHHTDDPTKSFANIAKHCKPGGHVIIWVYSHEGNAINRLLVEPFKTILIHHLPRPFVWLTAHVLTILVTLPVYSVYLLPLTFLPYYQYFQNWRKLSYRRNLLNVFDKLNAPLTHFLKQETIDSWFRNDFENVHISLYRGVSWRGSGTKKVC